jgi:FkbM family methyltransferase
MFDAQGVDLVIDIGANDGGYGREIRQYGYRGHIASFEPLADPFLRLQAQCERDNTWSCRRLALGEASGELHINIAGNSYSSSLLPMRDTHRTAAPESQYVGTQRVPVERLDAVFDDIAGRFCAPFLKIDTQGYESRVLDGASSVLERLAGVQMEMSLVELYEGEESFDGLFRCMADSGFDCWSIDPEFIDKASGRALQVNGTFFRR